MTEQNKHVYVVSYYSRLLNRITICCFDNEDSAIKYYSYINDKEDETDAVRIELDYAPIYSDFIINEEK